MRVRVLTFNTGNDFVAAKDLVALIDGSGADIVGLVELSVKNAAALDGALHESLPHRILYGEYIDGKGLFSSYPIQSCLRFRLVSGRSALDARLRIDGQNVAVFVAHPPPPGYWRPLSGIRAGVADVQALLQRAQINLPTLLLGDFNVIRSSRGYRLLQEAGFVDTFLAAGSGRGWTYPTRHQYVRLPLPRLVRIDYIWASVHFAPVASWVGPPVGSDHLPLFSELILQPE